MNLTGNANPQRYGRESWRRTTVRRGPIGSRSAAVPLPSPDTTASSRAYRSPRSAIVSLARRQATIKAYFYDPTGEKARAVKARYQGVCRGRGAYTQPRNGKGDAYAYCQPCHPGAIERR
jgi:hypothetical protein